MMAVLSTSSVDSTARTILKLLNVSFLFARALPPNVVDRRKPSLRDSANAK